MKAATVRKGSPRPLSLTYHLFRYHYHGFRCEPAVAVIEQILEGRTKEVDDEDVVQTFLAEIVDVRDAG